MLFQRREKISLSYYKPGLKMMPPNCKFIASKRETHLKVSFKVIYMLCIHGDDEEDDDDVRGMRNTSKTFTNASRSRQSMMITFVKRFF